MFSMPSGQLRISSEFAVDSVTHELRSPERRVSPRWEARPRDGGSQRFAPKADLSYHRRGQEAGGYGTWPLRI